MEWQDAGFGNQQPVALGAGGNKDGGGEIVLDEQIVTGWQVADDELPLFDDKLREIIADRCLVAHFQQ